MNITPQVPNLSTPTVLNPHTESLRRENNQREIITQPTPTSQSAAEKGVASDKERGRTPAQNNESVDFASISEQAKIANTSIADQEEKQGGEQESRQSTTEEQDKTSETTSKANAVEEEQSRAQALEQERIVSQLESRDKEVRAHEAAHASVGGTVTGAPSFSYTTGPDGKRYAVEGEVSVDLSTVQGDPKATIAKMQQVHAAALAPIHPSVQDTRVASTATTLILQAQSELLAELSAQRSESESEAKANSTEDNGKATAEGVPADEESDFEVLIKKTLDSQEKIAPSQSQEVVQRSLRIASFYSEITHAHTKPATYQFELTA